WSQDFLSRRNKFAISRSRLASGDFPSAGLAVDAGDSFFPGAVGAGVSFRIPAFLNAPAIRLQALSNSTAPFGVNTIRATTCLLPVGVADGGFGSSKRVEQSSSRSV